MRREDLCPCSGDRVGDFDTVYCLCGRVWYGMCSPDRKGVSAVQVIPEHDGKGHEVPHQRTARRIDEAFEIMMSRRKVAERMREEAGAVYFGILKLIEPNS